MRSNRTVVMLACLLVAAGLVGCARGGDKVLVFGTDTKIALDLSSGTPTKEPSITLGYSRHEAVWLPLIADAESPLTHRCLKTGEDGKLVCTDTVPATHECVVLPRDTSLANATADGTPMVCLPSGTLTTKFVGKTVLGGEDAYSVMASFGLDSTEDNEKKIAQYIATGLAARELARRGGASLVSSKVEPEVELLLGRELFEIAEKKPPITEKGKHTFEDDSDDLKLQKKRNEYLNRVLNILQDDIREEHAVAIWMAGVDLHNESLSFEGWKTENKDKHIEEMEEVYEHLSQSVLNHESINPIIEDEILSYLEIHRDNYKSMRNHEAGLRHKRENR